MRDICGVAILAGGKNTRMGKDKATLLLGANSGTTILRQTIMTATEFGAAPILVIGRSAPEENTADNSRAMFLQDDLPESGPIGGLQTALRSAGGTPLIVVACDMPALTADAFQWLASQPRGKFGVVAQNEEQWEPLFALYTFECVSLIESNLRQGRRSLHSVLKAGTDGFLYANLPENLRHATVNINTPEEWEEWLRSRESGS